MVLAAACLASARRRRAARLSGRESTQRRSVAAFPIPGILIPDRGTGMVPDGRRDVIGTRIGMAYQK